MKITDTTPKQVALYKDRECWRCQLVLVGDAEVYQKHCPRCCNDLDELIDQSTPEQVEERNSWFTAIDLGKIYQNWTDGYIRLMNESNEADYSSLDDFITEVMDHSILYLRRVLDQKLMHSSGLAYVRGVLNDCTLAILNRCEQLYLEAHQAGLLGDNDAEIREYWLERLSRCNGVIGSYQASPKALCHTEGDSES